MTGKQTLPQSGLLSMFVRVDQLIEHHGLRRSRRLQPREAWLILGAIMIGDDTAKTGHLELSEVEPVTLRALLDRGLVLLGSASGRRTDQIKPSPSSGPKQQKLVSCQIVLCQAFSAETREMAVRVLVRPAKSRGTASKANRQLQALIRQSSVAHAQCPVAGRRSWVEVVVLNVEVTGAARLYHAAPGGPQGYASARRSM
jgi:hypothetical protein